MTNDVDERIGRIQMSHNTSISSVGIASLTDSPNLSNNSIKGEFAC